VMAKAVTAGLRLHAASERSDAVLNGYKKAFAESPARLGCHSSSSPDFIANHTPQSGLQ
jgi:hypothetical protein